MILKKKVKKEAGEDLFYFLPHRNVLSSITLRVKHATKYNLNMSQAPSNFSNTSFERYVYR